MKRTIITLLLLAVAWVRVTAQDEKPYVYVDSSSSDSIVVTAYCTAPGQLDSLLVVSGEKDNMYRLNVAGNADESDLLKLEVSRWIIQTVSSGRERNIHITSPRVLDLSSSSFTSLDMKKFKGYADAFSACDTVLLPKTLNEIKLPQSVFSSMMVVTGSFPKLTTDLNESAENYLDNSLSLFFTVYADNKECRKEGNAIYSSDGKTLYWYDKRDEAMNNERIDLVYIDAEEIAPFALSGDWYHLQKITFSERLKHLSRYALSAIWRSTGGGGDSEDVVYIEFMGKEPPVVDCELEGPSSLKKYYIVADVQSYIESDPQWLNVRLCGPTVPDYVWNSLYEDRWQTVGEAGSFCTVSTPIYHGNSHTLSFDLFTKQVLNIRTMKDGEESYFAYSLPNDKTVRVWLTGWNDYSFHKYTRMKQFQEYTCKIGEALHVNENLVVWPDLCTLEANLDSMKAFCLPQYFLSNYVYDESGEVPDHPFGGSFIRKNEPYSGIWPDDAPANHIEFSLSDGILSAKGYYEGIYYENVEFQYDVIGNDVFIRLVMPEYDNLEELPYSYAPCAMDFQISDCTKSYYNVWFSGYHGNTIVIEDYTMVGMVCSNGQQIRAYVRETPPQTQLELGQKDGGEKDDIDVQCRIIGLGGGRYSQSVSHKDGNTIYLHGDYHSLAEAEDETYETTSLGMLAEGDYQIVLQVNDKDGRIPSYSEKMSFRVTRTSVETLYNQVRNPNIIHDLQGRPVNSPTTGFYIKDGKKILIP